MASDRISSFQDFYPFYLTEHSDKTCRIFHYIGTSLFLGIVVWTIVDFAWWKFLLMPLVGYGFAWIGHFVFEKNKPAAFQYPIWSLISDFYMLFHFLTGQLDKKLKDALMSVN